jgi:hypothetical protein
MRRPTPGAAPCARATPQRGAAIVTVVLLTLALFALAHGMLTLSLGELAASRAAARHLEARAAAESVVQGTLAAAGASWLDSVSIGGTRSLDALSLGRVVAEPTLRRVTEESWWVEGVGRVGVTEGRSARLAWALDPLERVTSLRAAVSVGAGAPVIVAGSLETADAWAASPPLSTADCAPWAPALEDRYLADPLAAVAVQLGADTLPSLGLLSFGQLLDRVESSVTGTGTPAPTDSLGACATSDPWNWGDPDRPWRPCGDHLALRGARGSIDVVGGVGQGVLVVGGDVTLRGGARFYGLVVASGALRVEDGATLHGMALVRGGLFVASPARIQASACWAVRVLAAQRPTLGRLLEVPGVGWIGPL